VTLLDKVKAFNLRLLTCTAFGAVQVQVSSAFCQFVMASKKLQSHSLADAGKSDEKSPYDKLNPNVWRPGKKS
jgi:hypothetical protein